MNYQKSDDGKNRLELIDPEYIMGIGEVLTFGTIKYQPNNWKKATPDDVERVKGSLLRHTMAYMNGEKLDPETGLAHLYHMGCNNMFLAWYDKYMVERLEPEHEGQLKMSLTTEVSDEIREYMEGSQSGSTQGLSKGSQSELGKGSQSASN